MLFDIESSQFSDFVFMHMGLFALDVNQLSVFFNSKTLQTTDNTCKFSLNVINACRMNVHNMNNSGVEKMRNTLKWLENFSKMKFK